MEFNALRCTVEDLDGEQAVGRDYQWHNWTKSDSNEVDKARNAMRRQTHVNDIPVRDFVEVCLDYRQMGLGGYDSWGQAPRGIRDAADRKAPRLGLHPRPEACEKMKRRESGFTGRP